MLAVVTAATATVVLHSNLNIHENTIKLDALTLVIYIFWHSTSTQHSTVYTRTKNTPKFSSINFDFPKSSLHHRLLCASAKYDSLLSFSFEFSAFLPCCCFVSHNVPEHNTTLEITIFIDLIA